MIRRHEDWDQCERLQSLKGPRVRGPFRYAPRGISYARGKRSTLAPEIMTLRPASPTKKRFSQRAKMHVHSVRSKSPTFWIALILITLLPLYYASHRYRHAHPASGFRTPTNQVQQESDDFVRNWLGTRLVSPFNPSALARYCNRTSWHPDLVFKLDSVSEGIADVRGNMLDFIFFAIEAGASIILPGIGNKSQGYAASLAITEMPFDSFFDEEWFLSTMSDACPHMAIYKPQKHHQLVDALPGYYLPRSRRMDLNDHNTKKEYVAHLRAWMEDKPTYQQGKLTLVNVGRTLWDVDTRCLPLGLRRNFGQLLQITPSIRRFAALVVRGLLSRHNITHLNPHIPIPSNAFYGAHVYSELDALEINALSAASSNSSTQIDAYISHALKNNLHIIYAASHNHADISKFAVKVASHRPPLTITSKYDLLPEAEADALRKLTPAQQSLVDYEVLQRCSIFGGAVKSSFSYNIAMSRTLRLEDEGRVVDPWFVMHAEEGVAFDDGVSRILGRDAGVERRVPRGMWP